MKKWLIQNKKRGIVSSIIYLFIILFIILLFTIQLPFEILLPGGIQDATRIIDIENSYNQTGSFNSSYVSVITKPRPFQYVYALVNNKVDILELNSMQRKLSIEELNKSSHIDKLQSINTSIIVAYNKANKQVSYDVNGLIVAYTHPEYKAFDNIKVGDIITMIDGKSISSLDDFTFDLTNFKCEDSFTLTIIRDDKTIEITTERTKYKDSCKLGVMLYENYVNLQGNPDFEISDDSGYGSSAGLMQAISIYNLITKEDLTHNYKIAGTGVIDSDGNVLPIAGIKQKVFGAIKNNVDIYFAPNILDSNDSNLYLQALQAKHVMNSDIVIVPVKTFDEALDYLLELGG